MMNYEEALEFINSRLRFGIKPGLERISALLEKLGSPQKKLQFVHVAGTNGKGSASTMIASAMVCAGKRTGLYTSPYICDFRERMQIDGQMIEKTELAQITETVKSLVEDDEILREEMTEFELITCIAFAWFAKRECDVVVLEVGLGGRLDATNIIESPLCSVIMRIDLDHTSVLGDTVSQIAAEKAGIIKPGCPVVMFPDQPEDAAGVIRAKAEELGCQLIVPDVSMMSTGELTLDGTAVSYRDMKYTLPLLGKHQTLNSITAAEALLAAGIEKEFIQQGIAKASIPARLEIISRNPLIIIDGAHNPNGAAALAQAIDDLLPGKRVLAVMGVLADKDYRCEFGMLGSRFSKVFASDGYSPRALSAEKLCAIAAEYTSAQAYTSPEAAFDAAVAEAVSYEDVIVVCGSLYLAGYLRTYIVSR